VIGTQTLATAVAVYGAWVVTPLGWKYAGIAWGYAFIWFVATDPVKLLAYRVLDAAKVEAKPKATPATKTKAKSTTNAETKPDAKPVAAPDTKTAPQSDAKSETKRETKAAARPDAKPVAAPVAKNARQPDAKSEARPETKADAKPDGKPVTAPDASAEAEPTPPASAGVAALLNTSLGDLLVAGLVKDPEDAGRIIAAAITQAEARVAAPKAPETDAEPPARSEPPPDGKAKRPTDLVPRTVK
jgi:hypothetical protein